MLMNCSHWSVPGVLRNPPIVHVFFKRGFVDTISGSLHDVCRSMIFPLSRNLLQELSTECSYRAQSGERFTMHMDLDICSWSDHSCMSSGS